MKSKLELGGRINRNLSTKNIKVGKKATKIEYKTYVILSVG